MYYVINTNNPQDPPPPTLPGSARVSLHVKI